MFAVLSQSVVPYPDPLPLSAPIWLLWSLLMLTFLLHVIPMNLVVGGSLIALVNRIKSGGEKTSFPYRTAELISRWLPVLIAATVTFGVAPLLFVQVLYGRLLYTSSILMGWIWLSVIPLLILAYYSAYYLAISKKKNLSKSRIIAALSSFLFVLIGIIFTANMSLMLRPEKFLPLYLMDSRGFSLNLTDLTLYPRFLHTLLAAMAVAGLALALYGWLLSRKDQNFSNFLWRHGLLWFVLSTALNFIVGTLFLLSFSRETLLNLVKNGPFGSIALTFGILLGLVTLGLGVLSIQVERKKPLLLGTVITLLLTLISMLFLRDQVRSALLWGQFEMADWTSSQWVAIAVFAVLLVTAALTIGWMCRKLALASGKD